MNRGIIIHIISALFFISFFSSEINAQEEKKPTKEDMAFVNQSDSKKEEIQRYIGYEELLFRYLSLPYDSTMNINERGNFVDYGFLYFMFLPLLFIIYFRRKNKWITALFSCLLVITVILATANSYLYDTAKNAYSKTTNGEILGNFSPDFQTAPIATITTKFYEFFHLLYTPFKWVAANITAQKDHVTYPILIGLFLIFSFALIREYKDHNSNSLKSTAFLFTNYFLFWLILSSGIVWYGFLILSLAPIFIFILLNKIKEKQTFHYKWLSWSFYAFTGIWVVMIFALRIGNITGSTPPQQYGQGFFHPVIYDYNSGVKDYKEVMDKMYPELYNTLEEMNKSNGLVYKIGTGLTYFVKNNHKRLFEDNQLGSFNWMTQYYKDKTEITNALKFSGFEYIILDLNTVTIDKTKNRSLTQKYNNFIDYITDNPTVQLINTNRVIEQIDPNTGGRQLFRGLSGKIVFSGSYAVFKLI